MNKNLQTVFHYHETTKHSQQRYARSLGYMDWATQPDPFRNYVGAASIELPLSDTNATIPYSLLDENVPAAPLLKESLAQFLQFSMGIAAWKESGGSKWAVRCNASSGNLHPSEMYLVLPPLLQDVSEKSSVLHYAPKEHRLEVLAEFESSLWEKLPANSFLVGLSSISWREVWKYGERAFRYVNLDAGHAWQSLVVSAKMLGWDITRVDTLSNADLNKIMGLNQKSRFHEEEIADMLLLVSPTQSTHQIDLSTLVADLPLFYKGIANELSSSMQEWEIIEQIENATSVDEVAKKHIAPLKVKREPTQESKEVVLKRRSIHVMDREESFITQEQFHTLLTSVNGSLHGQENAAHLTLFVNRVTGYESGLYILIRNEEHKQTLQEAMLPSFLWKEMPLKNLYFLDTSSYLEFSKGVSCAQDIASDGAFSLGMLTHFSEELHSFGAHRYKELYWECGMVGQELYLEATSMGLSGTGIGCFLDDMMHDVLGLKDNKFQVLYHFTVGRGYVDSRIQTQKAYIRG